MYRILLVDDEALIREGVSENVPWEALGYTFVGSCENGQEALMLVRSQSVDVIITDIGMPFMDGMKLTEILYDEFPEIKVIILSGYDDFEYAKKAIRFNVHEYLLKPITAKEMALALEGLCHRLDEEKGQKEHVKRMQSNYHKGQILLYSDVLLNLITGSKNEQESQRELRELGVNLEAICYRVGIVELDIYAKAENPDEKLKKESALMAFVVHNVSQEIIKKHGVGEVCYGKDHRTFILFHGNRIERFEEQVQKACEDIICQMNAAMKLEINVGIGHCVEVLGDIYLSCETAERALDYHYVLGGNQLFVVDQLEKKGPLDNADFIKERDLALELYMENILLHIKENSLVNMEKEAANLQSFFIHKGFDRRSVGTALQRMIQTVDALFRASEPEEIPDELAIERVIRRIQEAGEMKKAVSYMGQYIIAIASFLDQRRNTGGKKYAHLAMDYLEKNYADCNLGLGMVCSYLNISASRFSTIFKNTMGQTFLDVLCGIRMEKAKELLVHTDLKNYEIAERVGYNDPHYFSIAFKKFVGKTPTEYAKEMRK